MKLWATGDWWRLRCELMNGRSCNEQRILDKRAELAAALYRQTPAGQYVARVHAGLYSKAMHDRSFQAFKALIPGLIPPKRGRKPKAATVAVPSGLAVPAGSALTQRAGGAA